MRPIATRTASTAGKEMISLRMAGGLSQDMLAGADNVSLFEEAFSTDIVVVAVVDTLSCSQLASQPSTTYEFETMLM